MIKSYIWVTRPDRAYVTTPYYGYEKAYTGRWVRSGFSFSCPTVHVLGARP